MKPATPAPVSGSRTPPDRLPGWEAKEAEDWASWMGVPVLELLAMVGSTNQHLRKLVSDSGRRGGGGPLPPFATVIALGQSAGRGRDGRRWHSPSGAGLCMSVLLPMPVGGPPGVAPLAVGLSLALAVESLVMEPGDELRTRQRADAPLGSPEISSQRQGFGRRHPLSELSISEPSDSEPFLTGMPGRGRGLRLGLKWPNDLIVEGPSGWKKLGGVLCDVVPGGIVAGIGVNLRTEGLPTVHDLEGEGAPGMPHRPTPSPESGFVRPLDAISIQEVLRALHPEGPNLVVGAPELARALIRSLRRWADPAPSRMEGQLREAWEERDLLCGREVQVVSGPRGRVHGVTEDGALVVGGQAVLAGSVRCVDDGVQTPQSMTTEQELR